MSSDELLSYLQDKYDGKKVRVVADFQRQGDNWLGLEGTVIRVQEDRHGSFATVDFGSDITKRLVFPEIILVEPKAGAAPAEKEVKIEFAKRTIENVDEFGNSYILQLLPPDEKYIYLSSALRTLLNIVDGDYVNFAFDKGNKSYYICKEIDSANGYLVTTNKIESTAEWRNLYNTFNFETIKPEEAKLKLHVSHYEREQEEHPEYKLFLINEPWIGIKKDKEGKKTSKDTVKSRNPYERDSIYTPSYDEFDAESLIKASGETAARVETIGMWDPTTNPIQYIRTIEAPGSIKRK